MATDVGYVNGDSNRLWCVYLAGRDSTATGLPLFTSAKQLTDYFDQVLKDAGAPGFDMRFGRGIPDGQFLTKAIIADLLAA